MNNLIIAVFNTEEQAYEGLSTLKSLHKKDDLIMYASAVINKNDNGEVKIKQMSDKGPIGSVVGALCGALVGVVGGPVAMAAGAYAGMVGGMFFDIDDGKVNVTFLAEVSEALKEGKTAVVADVTEDWIAPVNAELDKLDAEVYRRRRSEVAEDQFNRELDELNAELTELDNELEQVDLEMKETIQKKINAVSEKKKSLNSVIDVRIKSLKTETKDKKEAIDTRILNASESRKDKLIKQKNALAESYTKQNEKLVAASVKASEYFL